MIRTLNDLGCEVTLASSVLCSETPWTKESIRSLEKNQVHSVRIYYPTILDNKYRWLMNRMCRVLNKAYPINSSFYTPPGMRLWFSRVFQEISPDVVIMSYAFWDGLIRHNSWHSVLRIIDTIDLFSLNFSMQHAVMSHLPERPIDPVEVSNQVLQEDFFKDKNLRADPSEFGVFDHYDYAIAISRTEADLIKDSTNNARVVLIPVTQEVRQTSNSYTGPAIFPTGPNVFNTQGYCYFVKKVLPHLTTPSKSFKLQVTGYVCDQVKPNNAIILSGYLPELQTAYASAKFMVCPVFGGTGQQIKIVEAMAHGLAPVALTTGARGSPIQHGFNGVIASNAIEFAEYVSLLWNDRVLCECLGHAARETIRHSVSDELIRKALSDILSLN